MMWRGAGFAVVDLGTNVPPEKYLAAAQERGVPMDYDAAREAIYGMPYDEWKAKYQKEASTDQKKAFEKSFPNHG